MHTGIEENQTCDFDGTKTEYFLLHKATEIIVICNNNELTNSIVWIESARGRRVSGTGVGDGERERERGFGDGKSRRASDRWVEIVNKGRR